MRATTSSIARAFLLIVSFVSMVGCASSRNSDDDEDGGLDGGPTDAGVDARTRDTGGEDAGPEPGCVAGEDCEVTLTNYDMYDEQIAPFDVEGNTIDAHNGHIAQYAGEYYWYGTSYDCGFWLDSASSPFCGFKAYSSPDLLTWTDRGFLFDAQTEYWQEACGPDAGRCDRPRMMFDIESGTYTLWFTGRDVSSGFHVMTSTSPSSGFVEQDEPTLAVNDGAPAGLTNGDHDLFIDDDGSAYIVYTDMRGDYDQIIERLDDTWLTGSGKFERLGITGTQSPSLFKRANRYYLIFSNSTCVFCTSVSTSFGVADDLLGPWNFTGGSELGVLEIESGRLHVSGGDIALSAAGAGWTDYRFSFDTTPLQTGGSGAYAQSGWAFRGVDPQNTYVRMLGNFAHTGFEGGNLTRATVVAGQYKDIEVMDIPFSIIGGETYAVEMTIEGDQVQTRINGMLVETHTDSTFDMGRVGFREAVDESARFDNILVETLDGDVLLQDDFSGSLSNWGRGTALNDTSCNGRLSSVNYLPTDSEPSFLFLGDMWRNGTQQALANYYFSPLMFQNDGNIAPFRCSQTVDVLLWAGEPTVPEPSHVDATSGDQVFTVAHDIAADRFRFAQTFRASRAGTLTSVAVAVYQHRDPPEPLLIQVVRWNGSAETPGEVLGSLTLDSADMGWSARSYRVETDVAVEREEVFAVVLRSDALGDERYGMASTAENPYSGGALYGSRNAGVTWVREDERDLKFEATVE